MLDKMLLHKAASTVWLILLQWSEEILTVMDSLYSPEAHGWWWEELIGVYVLVVVGKRGVGGVLKVNNRWEMLFTFIKQHDLFDRQ